MTNDELLHKWVNGEISDEELKIFKLRPEYPSLVELYKNTSDFSLQDFDSEVMLTDILDRKKKAVPEKKIDRRIIPNWIKYGIAASVLFFAGWFIFTGVDEEMKYATASGQQVEGTLPDESTFVLNADSELSYSKNDWKNVRTLKLKGEAFFHVKAGERFVVNTPTGKVEVLGTKFNVWSRNDVLEVKCQSGKVAVHSDDGKIKEELTRNNALRIDADQSVERWQIPMSDKAAWMEGISRFRKVPLSVVLEELERQYGINIDRKDVNVTEIISCNFQHKDLKLALKTTLTPLDIQYEIKNDKSVYLYQ